MTAPGPALLFLVTVCITKSGARIGSTVLDHVEEYLYLCFKTSPHAFKARTLKWNRYPLGRQGQTIFSPDNVLIQFLLWSHSS